MRACEGSLRLLRACCGVAQPESRRAGREAVTGMQLGGLTLEPQDVEVLTKVRLVVRHVGREGGGREAVAGRQRDSGRAELC